MREEPIVGPRNGALPERAARASRIARGLRGAHGALTARGLRVLRRAPRRLFALLLLASAAACSEPPRAVGDPSAAKAANERAADASAGSDPRGTGVGAASQAARAEASASAPPAPSAAPDTAADLIWLALGGSSLRLELALTPQARFRGLSGREDLPRNAGMLFVWPSEEPQAMVMRDCPAPIDVAFADAQGRVVALHTMPAEPPRGADEPAFVYEARLPVYASGVPVRLALEVPGGRLRELGVEIGAQLPLDLAALFARAR